MTRRNLAFWIGGLSVVWNATALAFLNSYQPSDERAAATVGVILAVNAGLSAAAAYLTGTDAGTPPALPPPKS